jgi:O-antigen/teichoic acid export membrane protein
MFIVNPLVGPAAVGLYSVAVMLAQLVWQGPGALSEVLFPRVAARPREEGARLTAVICRQAFAGALVLSLFLALLAAWILVSLFGRQFLGARGAMWALLPGVVALSASMVLAQFLAGIGKPSLNSVASVFAFLANLACLFTLVPRLGILGAGIASSLGYTIHAAIVSISFRRETGFGWREFLVPRRADLSLYSFLWQGLRARSRPTDPGAG